MNDTPGDEPSQIWHAPHGRMTRVVSWLILACMALCVTAVAALAFMAATGRL